MRTRIVLGVCILAFSVSGGPFGPERGHAQEASSSKLSAEFQPFLGSNSEAVVTGLRNGTPVTLTETTPGQPPTATTATTTPPATTVTIDPPTGKMGNGEVSIALSLARHQLNQAGIESQPTASQLQAALTGGSVTNSAGATTELQGVLAMRSEGMGWGQIAQEMGTKLGWVISGAKAANAGIASRTAPPSKTAGSGIVDAGGEASGPSKGGIVTGRGHASRGPGSGAPGRSAAGRGIVTGSGRPVGAGAGRGIVTGSGRPVGTGAGSGIVTGSGRPVGTGAGRGIVTGHGHGGNPGLARGHSK